MFESMFKKYIPLFWEYMRLIWMKYYNTQFDIQNII